MKSLKISESSILLIDTCFLIDSYAYPDVFEEFLTELKTSSCYLLAIPIIRTEFIRSENRNLFIKKKKYFDQIIDTILPIRSEFTDLADELMLLYGNSLKGVSIADLYLGCVLKHQSSLKLLTRNHKDFPLGVFERSDIRDFELPNRILTYASYRIKRQQSKTAKSTHEDIPF